MKLRHSFRYTIVRDGAAVTESFELEADRLAAIEHALRLLREMRLSQVEASCDQWRHTVCPGCFLAAGAGIVISKLGSSPKQKDSVVRFLGGCPGLRENDWCYHFTTTEPDLDDMALRYVETRVGPALARYFDRVRAFTFRCCAGPVEIPPWLDAEFYQDQRVLVLYGLASARPTPSG